MLEKIKTKFKYHETSKGLLINGECFEAMEELRKANVVFDAIITDVPYGTVKDLWKNTGWDTVLDHKTMLNYINDLLRMNGACLLFSQDPYTGKLMTDTHGNVPFSYRLTWLKDSFANCLLSNKAPVNYTEDINVFFKKYDTEAKHPLRDYAIRLKKDLNYSRTRFTKELGHGGHQHFMEGNQEATQFTICTEKTYNQLIEVYSIDKLDYFKTYKELEQIDFDFKNKYPKVFNLAPKQSFKSNVLSYKKQYQGLHPTQKPEALMQDLIKTYTNEGDLVLDFTMGSGSTCVACYNTKRKYIGIELEEKYFKIACNRIEHLENTPTLF